MRSGDDEAEITDRDLEKYEIDSDLEDEDEDEEDHDEGGEDDIAEPSQNSSQEISPRRPVENRSLQHSPRLRNVQQALRGMGNGSIGRVEVDMVFVSACVSGLCLLPPSALPHSSNFRPKASNKSQKNIESIPILGCCCLLVMVCHTSSLSLSVSLTISLSTLTHSDSLKYIQSQICFDVADAVEKFCTEILGQYATRERDEVLMQYASPASTTACSPLYFDQNSRV
jgi:hypothetical protein